MGIPQYSDQKVKYDENHLCDYRKPKGRILPR